MTTIHGHLRIGRKGGEGYITMEESKRKWALGQIDWGSSPHIDISNLA